MNSIAGAGATVSTNQVADAVISQKEMDLQGELQVQGAGKARILVVEDNEFVREGIVRLIDGAPDLVCCGEADRVASIPGAMARCSPDLVLMDLRFRDGEAIGLMNSLALGQSKPSEPGGI